MDLLVLKYSFSFFARMCIRNNNRITNTFQRVGGLFSLPHIYTLHALLKTHAATIIKTITMTIAIQYYIIKPLWCIVIHFLVTWIFLGRKFKDETKRSEERKEEKGRKIVSFFFSWQVFLPFVYITMFSWLS